MTAPRFGQRYVLARGSASAPAPSPPPPPPVVDKRKPKSWALDISRTPSQRGLSTVAQRQLASQFDGWIHSGVDYDTYQGDGGGQFQTFKNNLTATCDYILNDASNPYRNQNHKSVTYQIDSEQAAAEIVSIVRSGTTLTMTFDRDPPGIVLSGAVSLGQGLKVRLLGTVGGQNFAVFNGDYTTTGTGTNVIGTLVSYDMTTKTVVCTVANSGTTATDTSRTGVAIARSRGLENFETVCSLNAWTYRLGTSGRRFTWTNTYGAYDINCTLFAPTSGGLTYSQIVADKAQTRGVSTITGLAGHFQDNVNSIRADANGAGDIGDWDRDGVSENRNGTFSSSPSTSVQASHRAGKAKYAQRHKSYSGSRIIIANADNDLTGSGWTGIYDGAIHEIAEQSTTATCVARAAGQASSLIGDKISIYCANSRTSRGGTGNENDYAFMRAHFARALVVGYAAFAFNGDTYVVSIRHDEMDSPLGTPIDAPITAANAGSNLWVRRYTNGLAVFYNNPSTTYSGTPTASEILNVASYGNYRKLSAADIGRTPLDAAFNNGAAVTSLTLAPPWKEAPGGASRFARIGAGAILIRSDT